ncbi:MAG: PAS domain-containing protein [Anaerolineae bacterium]|nr:PAS domain-containing protein [Anaerolineae bacterium]
MQETINNLQPFANLESACQGTLAYMHQILGFRLWMIGRVQADDWSVLHIEDFGYDVDDESIVPWAESFFSKYIAGDGPRIVPSLNGLSIDSPSGKQLSVGAYVGVPITNEDGTLLGSLMAIDPDAQPESIIDHIPLIELIARLLGTIFAADLKEISKPEIRELPIINEEKQTEVVEPDTEEMERRNLGDYLDTLLLNMPVGLAILEGPEFRYFRVNQLLAEINGVPIEDHIGKTLAEVLPDAAPDILPGLRQVMERGVPSPQREFSTRLPNNPQEDRHFIDAFIPIIGEDGEARAVGAIVIDISERVRMEEALRESEARFQQFAEAIDDVFAISDVKSRAIIYASPAYERIWGHSVQELYEDPSLWNEAIHPDDRQRAKESWNRMVVQGGVYEEEYRVISPDGVANWVRERGFPIRDESGKVYRVAVVVQDITQQVQIKAELELNKELFQTIMDESNLSIYVKKAEDLSHVWVSKGFEEATGIDRNEALGKTNRELFGEELGLKFDVTDWQVLSGKRVELEESPDGINTYWSQKFPIKLSDGQTYLCGIGTDITDRKRTEKELEESEERFRDLYNHAPAAYIAVGKNTLINRVNQRTADLLGYDIDELIGRPIFDFYADTPDGLTKARKVFRRFMSGEPTHDVELQMRRADGKIIWISLNVNPVLNGKGDIVESRSIVIDITARMQAKAQLEESETRFKQITEAIDEVVTISDIETSSVLYASPAFEKIWGRSVQQLYDDFNIWDEAIHSDDLKRVQKSFLNMVKDESIFDEEYRVMRPDGTTRWVHDQGYLIYDESGEIYRIAGKVQDITLRKQAENALKESEERFKQIADVIDDVFVISDVIPDVKNGLKSGAILYANPAYEKHWGRSLEELYDNILVWYEAIHPDDREWVLKSWKRMLVQGDPFEEQFRVIHSDGSVHWVLSRGYPVHDEKGKTYRSVGIAQDITEKVNAEKSLHESEERFKQIADASDDVFVISDINKNSVLYASPAYENIWGRSLEELYKDVNQWDQGIHPDDRQTVLDKWAQMLAQGEYFEDEFRILRPDGSIRWVRDRHYPVSDENGKVFRVAGIIQDITARKQAEDALNEERWRLENILRGTNVGTWEWNVQTGEIEYNERWAEIIGYTGDEISPVSAETLADFVHPDDLKASDDQLKKHFKGEIDYYVSEIRLKHRDGHWVWVLDRGRVFSWTDDGKPLMMFGTHQDISNRKRTELMLRESEKKFQELSRKDGLTGLLNRRGWEESIAGEESRARRYEHQTCIIILDLDGLKEINDKYGHSAGDDLIIRTAECLQSTVRAHDKVARIGGDEFAILGVETGKQVSETIIKRINETLSSDGVSVSWGMAMRKSSFGLKGAIAEADALMYKMKAKRRKGRN